MTVLKPEDLFERLRGGRVLVTGNSRLARVLAARYGEWRMALGDRQWASPLIRSWEAWLGAWWDDAVLQGAVAGAGAVPGRQQLLALWEKVVGDDPAASALVSPASLAAELADTRSLVVEWRIETGHPAWFASSGNENCAAFRRWNRAFEEQCAARGWLPPEDRLPRRGGCQQTEAVEWMVQAVKSQSDHGRRRIAYRPQTGGQFVIDSREYFRRRIRLRTHDDLVDSGGTRRRMECNRVQRTGMKPRVQRSGTLGK